MGTVGGKRHRLAIPNREMVFVSLAVTLGSRARFVRVLCSWFVILCRFFFVLFCWRFVAGFVTIFLCPIISELFTLRARSPNTRRGVPWVFGGRIYVRKGGGDTHNAFAGRYYARKLAAHTHVRCKGCS